MHRFRINRNGHANGDAAAPANGHTTPLANGQQPASMPLPAATPSFGHVSTEGLKPGEDVMRFSRQSADPFELEFIKQVQERMLAEPDLTGTPQGNNPEYMNRRVAQIVEDILFKSERVYSEREKERLTILAQGELLGLGPLELLLNDDTITEVMVNGPDQVWIERDGRLYETDLKFRDDEHVRRIITRIVSPLGRRCDESSPMVDARLPDGSRVNAIIPPLCLNGPSITIRKFSKMPLTAEDLVRRGSLTSETLEVLRACVLGRLNIVVSGGTGAGKTTMLNVLSGMIPADERIVTIENAAELRLQQRHVITLESRPPNLEGTGEVTIRDLVINALRMRPNRIVVGECRGGESLDMIQAMNTGHDGSMTTIHANSPRDSIHRIETMALMAGFDIPQRAIREQIAAAINLIVQIERFQDGSRRISRICEVTGMEGNIVSMSDIFVFKQQGVQNGRIIGNLQPTGIRPRFLEQLQYHNITLPARVFGFHE